MIAARARPAARVAIVGASGAVGRAAVAELSRLGIAPLRLGLHRGSLPEALVQRVGEVWPEPIDVGDTIGLRRFCEGCDVVLNCAGPTRVTGYRVGIASRDAGAHWVDVNDVDEREPPPATVGAGERTSLTAAGLMPGLSGVLIRQLAGASRGPGARLVARAGGLLAFSPAAALDFMERLARPDGAATAIFQGGRREQAARGPERDVALPFFRGRVSMVPYLTAEAERIARTLGLAEAHWLTVFAGRQTWNVLERYRAGVPHGTPLHVAASELSRASRADLAGQAAYQSLTYQLTSPCEHGGETERSLAVTLTDASEATGAVAALGVRAVIRGELRPGLQRLADALEPDAVWQWLRAHPLVISCQQTDGARPTAPYEEGVL